MKSVIMIFCEKDLPLLGHPGIVTFCDDDDDDDDFNPTTITISLTSKTVLMIMILGGHSYSILSFRRIHFTVLLQLECSLSEYLGKKISIRKEKKKKALNLTCPPMFRIFLSYRGKIFFKKKYLYSAKTPSYRKDKI